MVSCQVSEPESLLWRNNAVFLPIDAEWNATPDEVFKAVVDGGPAPEPDVVKFTDVAPVLWIAKAGPSRTVD